MTRGRKRRNQVPPTIEESFTESSSQRTMGMNIDDLPEKIADKVRAQIATFNENKKNAPSPEVNEAKKVLDAANRLAEAKSSMYGDNGGPINHEDAVSLVADTIGRGPGDMRNRIREYNLKKHMNLHVTAEVAQAKAETQEKANAQLMQAQNDSREFMNKVMESIERMSIASNGNDTKKVTNDSEGHRQK